jgi:hypothetical protein
MQLFAVVLAFECSFLRGLLVLGLLSGVLSLALALVFLLLLLYITNGIPKSYYICKNADLGVF